MGFPSKTADSSQQNLLLGMTGAPAAFGQMDQSEKTIRDFGEQWLRYPTHEGYFASVDWFEDLCGPLLSMDEIKGARVAEIGSGAGRVVQVLFEAGVSHVVAIEPSDAMEVLKQNSRQWADKIDYIQAPGEEIPRDQALDYVVSIGVLHHIRQPLPVVKAAYQALKPEGRMLIWLYGKEGNESYLRFVEPFRKLASKLPPVALAAICHVLNVLTAIYLFLGRFFPLPLRDYLSKVFGKFSWQKRFLVIYDQLNPDYAKYYTASEARALLEDAGFARIQTYHRHGYSWTVIGAKPSE